MPASQNKRRAATAVTALISPALVLSAMVAGSPAAAAASHVPANVPSGRAVVALGGVSAASVPGVTVDAVLSSIHSELVHGSAAALRRLAAAPGVLGVSADRRVRPTSYSMAATATSAFSWQGLGHDAGSPGAGAGAHVALIDTGVSDTSALNRASGHLVDAVDTSGFVDGDTLRTDGVFSDGYGHGTFMASLIAGSAKARGQRTVGIAPGAVVDVVKVAGDDGVTSFGAMMVGLNWVATHAATENVVNLSFGLDPDFVGGYGQDPLNLATEIVRYLGTNVVVSSGNVAGQVTDPGFDPWVITVGAADTRDGRPQVASFSGSAVVAGVAKPDLVAPGVGILGVLPASSTIATANPQALQSNGFYRGSGTSEATAIVSGLAALFVADHPDATTADVKASLRVAADPMSDSGSGAGLAKVARRVASSDDDARMGDAGASGEATFDTSAWDTNEWGAATWDSVRWGSVRWGSVRWGSVRWGSLAFEAEDWDSTTWDSVRWGSVRWGSVRWGSVRWGSVRWGSVRWGSDTWGSDSWGDDGGDSA